MKRIIAAAAGISLAFAMGGCEVGGDDGYSLCNDESCLQQAPGDNLPGDQDPVFGDEIDDQVAQDPVQDEPIADQPVDMPFLAFVDPAVQLPTMAPFAAHGVDPLALFQAEEPEPEPDPDPGEDPEPDPEPGDVVDIVTSDDLSDEEKFEIDIYRGAIFHGLDIGKDHYLDEIVIALQAYGIANDYVGGDDPSAGLGEAMEPCPFAKFYDNGFVPSPMTCELLVDMAKVEAYSELTELLDGDDWLPPVEDGEIFEEAMFWREQGAISSIEEARVFVRADLKTSGLCNIKPTPVESSYDKGVLLGRQLLAGEVNKWLEKQGHKGDYPKMSSPINVCNANTALLDPALKAAQAAIEATMAEVPLCEGYEPPGLEDQLQFSQAQIDYKKGVQQGILDEHSIAAVKVFHVVPCNVSDPLVVDLDGDGIELLPVHRGVDFDMWSTGRLQAVAWVDADDGFLAMDRNGDGSIDAGQELFGNINEDYVDGFAELSALDRPENGGNADGMLTPADAGFASLVVWQDLDTDGRSTAAELTSVASLGLTAIPTVGMPVDLRIAGNPVAALTHAESLSGPMLVGDAFLKTAPYPRLARR